MPISFSCPHCGHATQAADHFAGQTGPCVSCGAQVTIPMAGGYQGGGPPVRSSSSSSAGAMVGFVLVAALGVMIVGGGVLALLLLAVKTGPQRAPRNECATNLKQIGLAMHNYHDVYKTFPPAFIPDENGEPERSWRVLLLPFLDQQTMFQQYDFNEPWDAPENQFAVSTDVPTYRCPSDPTSAPTDTSYVVLTGPGTIFEEGKDPSIRNIIDGTSNTIMAVELSGSGINWCEPKDLDVAEFVAMFGTSRTGMSSSPHPGGLNVLMADGSVQFLSFNIDATLAEALATCNGQEPVGAW
ncbi:MAG: DUF1559 domain-containing protein [Planctomycetes bacterium]|nr:DUF1559 domain-containing protein [Planctomycetota bacterium]